MHGQMFPIELTGSCPWLTCLGVGQDIVQELQKNEMKDKRQNTSAVTLSFLLGFLLCDVFVPCRAVKSGSWKEEFRR